MSNLMLIRGFFYQIWAVGAIDCCGEGPAGFLWFAWLLSHHTLFQPLLEQVITLVTHILLQCHRSRTQTSFRRRKVAMMTESFFWNICVSGFDHPLHGRLPRCMCSCLSLLNHGRLDLFGIPLFLFCGFQHSSTWRLAERPESTARGLSGSKLSPEAPESVLHILYAPPSTLSLWSELTHDVVAGNAGAVVWKHALL